MARPLSSSDAEPCPACAGEGVTQRESTRVESVELVLRLSAALRRSLQGTKLATVADSLAFKVERYLVTGEVAGGDQVDWRDLPL